MQKIISLLIIVISLLCVGTFMYSRLEGWNLVNSLYFTTTTLTTIGYGDLHPTNNPSKIFTVVFALTGVATMLYALSILGTHYLHYLDSHKSSIENNVRKAFKKIQTGNSSDNWITLRDKDKKK